LPFNDQFDRRGAGYLFCEIECGWRKSGKEVCVGEIISGGVAGLWVLNKNLLPGVLLNGSDVLSQSPSNHLQYLQNPLLQSPGIFALK